MEALLRFKIARYYGTRALRSILTLFHLSGEGLRKRVNLEAKMIEKHDGRLFTKKAAFTLAEVLITLGIIGVVAAMTIPSIIQKTNQKGLEASFKKSYSNLHNAFNLVIAEGIPVFQGDAVDSNSEFAQAVYAKYKQLKLISSEEKSDYRNKAKNFNKNKPMRAPQCSQYMGSSGAFITPDGSILSILQNCGALWFTIDTNGLYKGPNALGHDIFIFVSRKDTTKLIPADFESEIVCDESGCHYNNTEENKDKCSNTSTSDINGATCATYALQNRCPWDSSKTYWECLP